MLENPYYKYISEVIMNVDSTSDNKAFMIEGVELLWVVSISNDNKSYINSIYVNENLKMTSIQFGFINYTETFINIFMKKWREYTQECVK